MLEIKIREANEADFKAIDNMIIEWSKWKIERAKTFLSVLHESNHLVLVAEADGQIVGILHLLFYLDILHGGLNAHVLLILVREGYRRRQIGRKLLDEAVKKAAERGVIEVHVDTTYKEAMGFYRNYGFKDTGVMLELTRYE